MSRAGWLLLAAAALGCGGGADTSLSQHGFAGAELSTPFAKPDLEFTDVHGKPYRLVPETAGKVTLVLFGYTSCPDVCPVHLANLAAVLDKLPYDIQRAITVVFVSTDPARDTAAVLEKFVTGFDPSFVGLSGTDSVVKAAQLAMQLLPAVKQATGRGTDSTVQHAAQVIAFTRDGMGRVEYPSGTRQKDWAHDLPLLVSFGKE